MGHANPNIVEPTIALLKSYHLEVQFEGKNANSKFWLLLLLLLHCFFFHNTLTLSFSRMKSEYTRSN